MVEISSAAKPSRAFHALKLIWPSTLAVRPSAHPSLRLLPAASGAFGFGWRLAERDAAIQTDVRATGREHLGAFNPSASGRGSI
jgi:hypothetical protein